VHVNERELAVVRTLAIDHFAAEVVRAWREVGIEPILLKGPTVAEWLYPDEIRLYGDADLLVEPERVWEAASVLERLGFSPLAERVAAHAHPWHRPDGASIDLHVQLFSTHATPSEAWRELQQWTEVVYLSSLPVQALNLPARALMVALHAAQHADEAKPREDLRRALRITPEPAWREAAQLADRLGVLPTTAQGLALDPDGKRLIERLALVRGAAIADNANAPLAIGVARFGEAPTARAKLGVLRDALWPSEQRLRREARQRAESARTGWLRLDHVLSLLARLPATVWTVVRTTRTRRPR
jgi:hypothetical protein